MFFKAHAGRKKIKFPGAPKLRKFCISFVTFLRKFCVVSTPNAYLFVSDRTFNSLHQEPQRRPETCAAHAGRLQAFFCARRGEISEILQNFRRIFGIFCLFWNKISVISTPCACFFGCKTTIDLIESFVDAICFAQRTLAEKNSNSARVARRNSGKF